MNTFKQEFLKAAKETPRAFFAPLIGACKAVIGEFRSVAKSTQSNIRQSSRRR